MHPRNTGYNLCEAEEEYRRFIEDLNADTRLRIRQWINDAVGLLEEDYRSILADLET
jgi:hypothetical protein